MLTEAKALESAYTANKLIARREPGTCHWCGDKRDLTRGDNAQQRAKHVQSVALMTISPMCAWQTAHPHNDGEAHTPLPPAATGPPAKHPVTGEADDDRKMCITCNLMKTNLPTPWCTLIIIRSNVTL